jgi:hypothetical protein
MKCVGKHGVSTRSHDVDLDDHIEDVVAHIEMEHLKDVALVGWLELWRHSYHRRSGPH